MKKTLIAITLCSLNLFASSPSKNSKLIDFLSITKIKETLTSKELKILVGVERKQLIIDSIISLCDKKNLECSLSDDFSSPVSRIILKIKGNKNSFKNIEKLID